MSLPAGFAFAQSYPPGSQIYRDAPGPGYRGLPPSWLVDNEDDQRPLPPPGYPAPQRLAPGPGMQAPATTAAAAPQTDVLRPPGAVGAAPAAVGTLPATTSSQAPVTTASLPPEDQPETGEPKTLDPQFKRQMVEFQTKEPAGTIIIDTSHTFLYLTLGNGKAIRYGIGVGREGFTWAGTERISRMSEWPDWHPPAEMIERQPYLPRMMAGGPGNPLGARALYLGKTLYRVHGTNQPSTIGKNVSSGCIRLLNEDIEDLYSRVQVGTRVVVLPAASAPAVASAQPMPVQPQAAPVAPAPRQFGAGSAISSAPLPATR